MLMPGELVTVVVPEIVPKRWWEHLLLNKTAFYIRTAFLFKPNVVVTTVPLLLGHAYRLRDLFEHDDQLDEDFEPIDSLATESVEAGAVAATHATDGKDEAA